MPATARVQVVEADLELPAHREAIVHLLDIYARDEMGVGRPLDGNVRERLAEGLREHPCCLVLLARAESQWVGLAVCFLGYSTFAARPLMNIHDLCVHPRFRRQEVATRLLEAVAARARAQGCCKLTLEVRADNVAARSLYSKLGFASGPSPYDFWAKAIHPPPEGSGTNPPGAAKANARSESC